MPASLEYLRHIIEPVDREIYGLFENEARQRLRGRDENDWPVLATALGLACAVWTEDADFFGTGIATWTTQIASRFFSRRKQSQPNPRRAENPITRLNAKKKFCANAVIHAYENYYKRVLDES